LDPNTLNLNHGFDSFFCFEKGVFIYEF